MLVLKNENSLGRENMDKHRNESIYSNLENNNQVAM